MPPPKPCWPAQSDGARTVSRPNQDRAAVSFYIARADRDEVERIARDGKVRKSEIYRQLVELGLRTWKESRP